MRKAEIRNRTMEQRILNEPVGAFRQAHILDIEERTTQFTTGILLIPREGRTKHLGFLRRNQIAVAH